MAALRVGRAALGGGRWPLGAAFSLVLLTAGTACAGALAWGIKAGGVRAGPGRLRA